MTSGLTEDMSQPLLPTLLTTRSVRAERETGTPYLETGAWRAPGGEGPPDDAREDEAWTAQSEALLMEWTTDWDQQSTAHAIAEASCRKKHLLLQMPTVIIPVILAPLLTSHWVSEESVLVMVLLVTSALTGALQPVLGMERKSEKHAQAAFRYDDMLTDAEEVLSKERRFRPRCALTIQKFKMRMDAARHHSPPVSVAGTHLRASSDSES